MTDQLMADFNIGAAALGNFSAFYFYSYVVMQIPTGILVDFWGPRKLLIAGAFVASLGTLIFGAASHIVIANLGRLLIGASVAVAWVALLNLSIRWFPQRKYAYVSGVALCVGVFGAVIAGVPLRMFIDLFSWRPVMQTSAILTLLLALAIWLAVRDDPSDIGYISYAPEVKAKPRSDPGAILSRLAEVLRYRNTWLLSFASAGSVGPVLAFSGLWGIPFLATHYGLTPARSATITSLLLIAMALGGPVLGAFSDRIGKRKPIYLASAGASLAGWTVLLFLPGLPIWLLVVLVIIIGFSSGNIIICFAYIKESMPLSLAGTASGVCNTGVMLGPMILQPAMGLLLDRHWSGVIENGVRLYNLGAYRSAFILMILSSLLAVVLISFTRETYCHQSL